MTTQPLRQPKGTPVGGQFAADTRAAAAVALVEDLWASDADPWNDLDLDAVEETPPAPVIGMGLDAEIALADDLTRALQDQEVEDGADVDARNARRRAARRRLVEEYGSLHGAAIALGESVAARAEHAACFTGEEAAADHAERVEAVRARMEAAQLAMNESKREAEELYGAAVAAARSRAVDSVAHLAAANAEAAARNVAERTSESYAAWRAASAAYGAAITEASKPANELASRQFAHAKPACDAYDAARLELAQLRHGSDEETRARVRALSDAYTAALADLRPLGGTGVWHERSTPAGVAAFEEALQLYPTDWVELSNAKRRRSNGMPVGLPVARVSTRRAHYTGAQIEETKKLAPLEHYASSIHDRARAALETYGRSTSAYEEWRKATAEDMARYQGHRDSEEVYVRTAYDVDRRHGRNDKPKSRHKWEWWTDPADPTNGAWRHPTMRMKAVKSEVTAELTTNAEIPLAAGRSQTFAVSAHELAHRMEDSVPGLKMLEGSYLTERATNEHGVQEQRTQIYRGEYAYKDHFPRAYTGKVYDDGSREILSTTADAIFGGRAGALVGIGDSDPDLQTRAFALGVMAGLGRKVD